MRRTCAVIVFLLAAAGQAMPIGQYIGALEAIRTADATAARTRAQQLLGAQIESPAGRFTADSALLHEVMANPVAARAHLDATIAALRTAAPAAAQRTIDPRLLERVRAEDAAAKIEPGGEIRITPPADEKTLEATSGVLGKAWRWTKKQFERLANWFSRWWPAEQITPSGKSAGRPKWIVTAIVIAIVVLLLILAFEVVRRSRAAGPEELVTSDPVASRRDEDPLSRGANEWERYAAQLAAAGRTREAIRAWYHAVLVTLYGAGILHFKKGRTNWEYIASLTPAVAWRGEFVALTRHFEWEWYGRDQSSAEALDEASRRAQRIIDAARRRAAA